MCQGKQAHRSDSLVAELAGVAVPALSEYHYSVQWLCFVSSWEGKES